MGFKVRVYTGEAVKTDTGWNSWNREVTALAHSQGVHQVLDPSYRPKASEKELFRQQQNYM